MLHFNAPAIHLPKLDLPPLAKNIITIAVVGGLVFAGYKIYKWNEKRKTEAGQRQEGNDLTKDIKTNTQKQTLPDSAISAMANSIASSLAGWQIADSDELAIQRNLLKIGNEKDFMILKDKFGTRTLSSGKLNISPDFTGTLVEAINTKIPQKTVLNYNLLLAKRGIKNRF